MKRALFLDRDGTLIVDTGYVRDPNDVTLLPGAVEMLREARALGFELIIVSNQSGVARGIITPSQLDAVDRRVRSLFAEHDVTFDDVRFCIHGPDDGCACRKPLPGLLRDAATARGIDLPRSVMLGDRDTDVRAGRDAGCGTTILLGGTEATSLSDVVPILKALPATTGSAG